MSRAGHALLALARRLDRHINRHCREPRRKTLGRIAAVAGSGGENRIEPTRSGLDARSRDTPLRTSDIEVWMIIKRSQRELIEIPRGRGPGRQCRVLLHERMQTWTIERACLEFRARLRRVQRAR